MTLAEIKAGLNGQSCGNTQKLQADQTVTIVPYSNVANCQNTAPPSPSKNATSITVANLINDACGVIFLEIDNSASGATDIDTTVGGNFNFPAPQSAGTIFDINGYTTATFLVTIKNGPDFSGLAAGAGFSIGTAYINDLAGRGNALLVGQAFVQRADITDAPTNEFVNNAFAPFTMNSGDTYNYTPSGAEIFSQQTTTGGSAIADFTWDFGCAGIPITDTTGFQITVPAGFDGTLGLCISATEGNVDYNEGC